MSEEMLNKIAEHLEFLGYEVSRSEGDGKAKPVTARHKAKANLLFKTFRGGLMVTTLFGTKADMLRDKRLEFWEHLNSLNKDLTTLRGYLDKDNDLILETWLPEHYEKKFFTRLVEEINKDVEQIVLQHHEGIGKFLV